MIINKKIAKNVCAHIAKSKERITFACVFAHKITKALNSI